MNDDNCTDVLIIGAGIAGLAAAESLRRRHVGSVVILEATDRYGGRLHTMPYADSYIELGANWIHGGSESNELFLFARQKSLVAVAPEIENRTQGSFFTADGQVVCKDIGIKSYNLFFEAECRASQLYSASQLNNNIPEEADAENSKQKIKQRSLVEFLQDEWERVAKIEFDEAERKQADAVFRSMLFYFRSHVGDDLSFVAANLHGSFENIPGDDAKMPDGMNALVNELVDSLPKECIRFNSEVNAIYWDQPATNGYIDYPVKVTTTDGKVWKAKFVICTIPLGVLKKSHEKLFVPPLPEWKVSAIRSLGFGKVEKIFLEFQEAFWEPEFGGIKLAWTEEDLKDRTLPENWYKVICSFDEVFRQPRILAAWVSGNEAETMLTLSDEEIIDTCTRLISQFTGKSIPAPVRLFRTTWCSNPYSSGAYSYPSLSTNANSFGDMAAPLPNNERPRLLFAGEATHPKYYSTLHGAYMAGLREAHRLFEFME